MKIHILFIAALALFASGCVDEPNFPDTPHIEFESLSGNEFVQNPDTLFVTIRVEDGDGDIGFKDDDLVNATCNLCELEDATSCRFHPTRSAFFIDSRDSCLIMYNIPYVEQLGQYEGIEGTIEVNLFGICCREPNPPFSFCPTSIDRDTVNLQMFILDRARNRSNIIDLPPIYLICD